jgi:hypothetical protein
MIVVTGAHRSGTSLWMQALTAAGFPYIGSAFSYQWQDVIGPANERGFYESLFRHGVHHATNPHPKTGRYLHPDEVRRHVVKVFVPGLLRSDVAFLDHIVATIRPWREYVLSKKRLFDLEEDYAYRANPDDPHGAVARLRQARSEVPLALQWWNDNYRLIYDLNLRRHHYQLYAFDTLVADPRATLGAVLDALGEGDLDAAVAVVDAELRTQDEPPFDSPWLTADDVAVFDELYDRIRDRQPLPAAFLDRMNATHAGLVARWGARRPGPQP